MCYLLQHVADCNSSTAYSTKHIVTLSRGFCGLAPAKSLELLFTGLEPSMSKLGSCVDEFELDLLKSRPLSAREQGMSQSDNTLLGSGNSTLHASPDSIGQFSMF